MSLCIGCAGWNLRRESFPDFPGDGTHLQRYAGRFECVEINSSFYRPHQRTTYVRWARDTPEAFRFSVKVPKQVTHVQRLIEADAFIAPFADQIEGLGEKLGVVLVQLPPSLQFDAPIAASFFALLRRRLTCAIVCEPRHATWFGPDATGIFLEFKITRAAADPAIVPEAALPGGDGRVVYHRWHGSPRMYYSSYSAERLVWLADQMQTAAAAGSQAWAIFDNTAAGAAPVNALDLQAILTA